LTTGESTIKYIEKIIISKAIKKWSVFETRKKMFENNLKQHNKKMMFFFEFIMR
jgi:hypothetical protein